MAKINYKPEKYRGFILKFKEQDGTSWISVFVYEHNELVYQIDTNVPYKEDAFKAAKIYIDEHTTVCDFSKPNKGACPKCNGTGVVKEYNEDHEGSCFNTVPCSCGGKQK